MFSNDFLPYIISLLKLMVLLSLLLQNYMFLLCVDVGYKSTVFICPPLA